MKSRLKHHWCLGHNYMTGVTFAIWMRLLAQNRFHLSPAYWHRVAFITLASLANSGFACWERLRHGRAIAAVRITRPPLFILGHWRSGTTLLHDLLAQDSAQFQFANTYRVVNPLTYLAKLIDVGVIRPVVDKVFPFAQTAEALAYVETGRAKGKAVITVAG